MKKALVVWGGWDGHSPKEFAEQFAHILKEEGFSVDVSDTLEAFSDAEKLKGYSLIVPTWTMDDIPQEYVGNISAALIEGVGMAGNHGGMCDAFRSNTDWQFITGSQFVGHPGGGIPYWVNICRSSSSPIVKGLEDFDITSEQYYIHVDPAVNVLATTTFPVAEGPHTANGTVTMPVVYTKRWGKGKVFYCSLGHAPAELDIPQFRELMRRGFVWAAKEEV